MELNKIYRKELQAVNWIVRNSWAMYSAVTSVICLVIYQVLFN